MKLITCWRATATTQEGGLLQLAYWPPDGLPVGNMPLILIDIQTRLADGDPSAGLEPLVVFRDNWIGIASWTTAEPGIDDGPPHIAPPEVQPLYRARVVRIVNVRNERGEIVLDERGAVKTYPVGAELSVYADGLSFGGYQDRTVITPPGAVAHENVWGKNLEKL